MRRSWRLLTRQLTWLGGYRAVDTAGVPVTSRHAGLASTELASMASNSSVSPPANRRQITSGTSMRTPTGHALADELPVGSELATRALDDALSDVEEEAEDSEVEILPFVPTGPGSQFIRTDPLGALPVGESLQRSTAFHEKEWRFETGKMARLADGSCVLRVGQTTLLATAVCVESTKFSKRDPLAPQFDVEYREKSFAVGRIPQGYNKREGMPKEQEILVGRRVDRALRPLYPKGFAHESQVTAYVLSADGHLDLDVAAINAASAALLCSDIPWAGPVAAVRVILDAGGKLHINAPQEQQELGGAGGTRLRLLVAATADRVVMLEAEGAEVSEEDFARALRHGAEEARKLLPPQLELAKEAGRKKRSIQLVGADLAAARVVTELAGDRVEGILRNGDLDKTSRANALQAAKQDVLQTIKEAGSFRFESARIAGSGCVSPTDLNHAFTALIMRTMRQLALEEGLRADGRGLIDCRGIWCEVDAIPVVHGSALFTRGETQSLCTVTVGGKGDEQRTEGLLEGGGLKRLAVHYSFPAFSINETSIVGMRREVGHSSLTEKALLPVMPPEETFPFPLRLNADTLASNGSSSLAAVCGGSLALADAGVPLTSLVAGVSIGLLGEKCWDGLAKTVEGETDSATNHDDPGRYELLTDVMGLEDTLGDMDFKIAGSRTGITACQLDVKASGGVPEDLLVEALGRSRLARLAILDTMEDALAKGRSPQAPTFGVINVNPGSIGRVIGKEGSNINKVCELTGARIDIMSDTGAIRIYAPSAAQFEDAKMRVLESAGENILVGHTYKVRVTRLTDFGAFVEFESGVRSLIHISELALTRVRCVEDAISLGETVEVLCQGRDDKGNIKLSRKAVLAMGAAAAQQQQRH